MAKAETKTILKAYSTVESKLSTLPPEDGQLIFVYDKKKIILDNHGVRTVYEQIQTIETEEQRNDLLAPIDSFYFVIETSILWRYTNGHWNQITTSPQEQIDRIVAEGAKQIKEVQDKGAEVLQSIPEDFATQMETKLNKQQGIENKGKVLVIGEDGNVVPGEVASGGGDGIAIINTMSGESPLVIPDSAERVNKRLELGGKTEQVQTSGKNLVNANVYEQGYLTSVNAGDKVSLTQMQKSFTTNMEVSSMQGKNVSVSVRTKEKTGKKYVFTDETDTIITGVFDTGSNNYSEFKNITIPKNAKKLFFSVTYDAQENTELQVELGTTVTTYEPYTGGKPSPSPEYPQEIKNSGKWNEEKQKYEVDVKVVGKNLFDVNYFAESENYQNKEGDATYWKYATFKVKPNTTYTVSKRKSLNVNGAINNGIYYGGALAFNNDVNSVKITTKDDGVFYVIFFYRSEDVNILKEMDIQIELGETLTEYEPYKEQTLTLTSDRPITKWDKLVEQDGQIGWLYNSVNETIDGKTGKWSIQPASKIFYRTDITFPIAVPFCSELLGYDYSSVGYKKDTGISINNLGILCITLPEEVELTLDAYKQYLADNPLHVLYKDDSEEFVPLPQSEQNAIRALKAYYPTTVITVDGGELDPDIKVTYTADTKNYIDNKFAQLQKSLVNTNTQLL